MKKKTMKKRISQSWKALEIVNNFEEVASEGWRFPSCETVKRGRPVSGKTMKAICSPEVIRAIESIDDTMAFEAIPTNLRDGHKYVLLAEKTCGSSYYNVRVVRATTGVRCRNYRK